VKRVGKGSSHFLTFFFPVLSFLQVLVADRDSSIDQEDAMLTRSSIRIGDRRERAPNLARFLRLKREAEWCRKKIPPCGETRSFDRTCRALGRQKGSIAVLFKYLKRRGREQLRDARECQIGIGLDFHASVSRHGGRV